MNNLVTVARFQIHTGKLAEFKKVAEECNSITKEKDKDTLQYDWYFDEAQTECVVRETYPDSNALLTHLANIGDLFGKLASLGTFSGEIYGQPSQELLQATTGLNIKVYSFFQGL
jgi:quinol monooxygenase YgiN